MPFPSRFAYVHISCGPTFLALIAKGNTHDGLRRSRTAGEELEAKHIKKYILFSKVHYPEGALVGAKDGGRFFFLLPLHFLKFLEGWRTFSLPVLMQAGKISLFMVGLTTTQ